MIKRFFLITQLSLIYALVACSQHTGKKNIEAFYLGHSLSDKLPEMVWGLAKKSANTTFGYGYQRINGTPLRNQWNQLLKDTHPEYLDYTDSVMLKTFDSTIVDAGAHLYRFFDKQNGLASGRYTHLVMTESVPRYYGEGWGNIEDTYRYTDSFYNYAKKFNPDIKPYLYEVWHCINSGTPKGCDHEKNNHLFRERLDVDLPMWESVVDKFNSTNPRQKMKLIPVGQALAHLYDAIERREVPGIQSMRSLFTDDIHVNDTLRYFNTCVHYAVLFERSPVGLSNELFHLNGYPFIKLNKAMAEKLQRIAWQAVKKYQSKKNRIS